MKNYLIFKSSHFVLPQECCFESYLLYLFSWVVVLRFAALLSLTAAFQGKSVGFASQDLVPRPLRSYLWMDAVVKELFVPSSLWAVVLLLTVNYLLPYMPTTAEMDSVELIRGSHTSESSVPVPLSPGYFPDILLPLLRLLWFLFLSSASLTMALM